MVAVPASIVKAWRTIICMEPMIRCNTCDQTDLHTQDKSKLEECYLLMWCVFYKSGTFFTSNKNIENVTIFRDSRTAESRKIR